MNNIFIPEKIKVGYQCRKDTYTGKLAYVIYYDDKGVLRKEGSWNSWRDKNIPFDDFDNSPVEGFVLNKKVGGHRYHYDMRQTYVRVYDPRGFEFEISVPNLLYILENTNSIIGKGLEGEFVYGWNGTELLLIPTSAPEYKELTEKSAILYANKHITGKELQVGALYLRSNGQKVVYICRSDVYHDKINYFVDRSTLNHWNRHNDPNKPMQYYVEEVDDTWKKDLTFSSNNLVKYVSTGKHYWFAVLSDNNDFGIISKKSINKTIVKKLQDSIDADTWNKILDKIVTLDAYSPVNFDNQEIVVLSKEQMLQYFEAEKSSYYRRNTFISSETGFGNLTGYYYFIDDATNKIYVNPNYLYSLKNKTGMNIDKFMDIYKPVAIQQYLENGYKLPLKYSLNRWN